MTARKHDIEAEYVRHTDLAVQVRYEGEKHWLPLSQIEFTENLPDLNPGDEFEITLPEWLLESIS